MTITLDIMRQALRESNIIGVKATPTSDERAEALQRLQSLVSSVFGSDVGENLEDWPVGVVNVNQTWPSGFLTWNQNYWSYPRANVRLLLNAEGVQNVYLPEQPNDGARVRIVVVNQDLGTSPVTLYGNGRLVEGSATLLLNDNVTAMRTLFYDAERADWVRVTDLTEDGEFPFPIEFDDFFITKLAMRLNPRYGRALTAESGNRMTEMMIQLKARYRQKQSMPTDPAVLRITDPGRYGYARNGGRYGWMN